MRLFSIFSKLTSIATPIAKTAKKSDSDTEICHMTAEESAAVSGSPELQVGTGID